MFARTFIVATLGLATLGLAACSEQPAEVEQAPEGVAGLTVDNARVVLPAVSGNPAAVYFDVTYEGDADATLSECLMSRASSVNKSSAKLLFAGATFFLSRA